jgi:hypothetical protein
MVDNVRSSVRFPRGVNGRIRAATGGVAACWDFRPSNRTGLIERK